MPIVRDHAPSHYLLEIQSYSQLCESIEDGYESNLFEACNYNWRLILYPTGNKQQNGRHHISLYLEIVDRHRSPLVNFSLYVFDYKREKYVGFPDSVGVVKTFDKAHPRWGCDQFISIANFQLAENGHLSKKGSCKFGVEIFLIEPTNKVEVLSLPPSSVYAWPIKHYKNLKAEKDYFYSEEFTKGGRKWKLKWYPRGSDAKDQFVSVYLNLNDAKGPVYTKFEVQVIDQHGMNNPRRTKCHKFDSEDKAKGTQCGFSQLMPIRDLEDKTKGYLIDDTVRVAFKFLAISNS